MNNKTTVKKHLRVSNAGKRSLVKKHLRDIGKSNKNLLFSVKITVDVIDENGELYIEIFRNNSKITQGHHSNFSHEVMEAIFNNMPDNLQSKLEDIEYYDIDY